MTEGVRNVEIKINYCHFVSGYYNDSWVFLTILFASLFDQGIGYLTRQQFFLINLKLKNNDIKYIIVFKSKKKY